MQQNLSSDIAETAMEDTYSVCLMKYAETTNNAASISHPYKMDLYAFSCSIINKCVTYIRNDIPAVCTQPLHPSSVIYCHPHATRTQFNSSLICCTTTSQTYLSLSTACVLCKVHIAKWEIIYYIYRVYHLPQQRTPASQE